MSSLRRFARLSSSDRSRFLSALFLLPFVALGLRLLGLRRTQALLGGRLFSGAPPPADGAAARAADGRSMARMIAAAAARGPVRARCLTRSVLLWWLLRRRGVASSVRLGVRRDEEGLHAHAWVDADGVALNDTDDVTDRLDALGHEFTSGPGGEP